VTVRPTQRADAVPAPAPAPAGKTPPGPGRAETPVILARMATNRLDVMTSFAARYGDAVRLPLGPKPLYFFNSPEHAKHVLADNASNYHKGIGLAQAKRALGDGLLTSEGDTWRRQRRTIQPVFQAKRMARQADALVAEVGRMVARLRTRQGGGPVDIRHEMTGLSLGVLGSTLLDLDLSGYESMGGAFETVQNHAMFEMMTLGAVPPWVPLRGQLKFRSARQELLDVVQKLVNERRANPSSTGDDVLSRLIASLSSDPDPANGQQRLSDELITLLLAGHETTASTLSWAFYLIDQHPEVGHRLAAEATSVLGDRTPTYEDLHGLVYTSMVVEEVMRLYPAVWLLSRRSLADDDVNGYHVPAGTDVLICPYTMHRHPGLWFAPNRFDPERFAPDKKRIPYAYIPFGGGPRFCVGNHLGMMEATFAIAMIAREMRLVMKPGYKVVPEANLSLGIRGGLPMTIHPAGS
jgi:enediyne biosynthesis protein E7